MFGFFSKKKKDKAEKETASSKNGGTDISHLSDAKQQLFAQLKAKREELGPEEIAKMQRAVKADALKKQIKSDIESDEDKRNRLLDGLRFELQSDK